MISFKTEESSANCVFVRIASNCRRVRAKCKKRRLHIRNTKQTANFVPLSFNFFPNAGRSPNRKPLVTSRPTQEYPELSIKHTIVR